MIPALKELILKNSFGEAKYFSIHTINEKFLLFSIEQIFSFIENEEKGVKFSRWDKFQWSGRGLNFVDGINIYKRG